LEKHLLWKKRQRTDRQAFAIALLVSLAQARLPVLLKSQNEANGGSYFDKERMQTVPLPLYH
jgi:hypothetical protein